MKNHLVYPNLRGKLSLACMLLVVLASCSDEGALEEKGFNNSLRVVVSAEGNDAYDMGSAQGYLIVNGSVVEKKQLRDVNDFSWPSAAEGSVILKVTADGFEPFVLDLDQQRRDASRKVITVMLKPALAFKVETFVDDDIYD
jgi:hypothetical protein